MLYILDCNGSEVDRFKIYNVLDTETCRLQSISGYALLKSHIPYRDGTCAYVKGEYDFKTANIHIRVDKNVVYIEHTNMLYIMAGARVECVYKDSDIVHVRWRLGRNLNSEVLETSVNLSTSRFTTHQPIRTIGKAGNYADLIKRSDILKIIYGEDYRPDLRKK